MIRARRSAVSARLLLDTGDMTGACNRAYYAMFDAARAALFAAKATLRSEAVKTHSGLISAFSLHLIKPGFIAGEFGKSLGRVDRVRTIADYSDEDVDPETSVAAVDQADQFIDAVDRYLAGLSQADNMS